MHMRKYYKIIIMFSLINVSLTLDKLSYFRKCCSGSPLLTGSIYLAVLGSICGLIMVGLGSMAADRGLFGILRIVGGILNILSNGLLMYGSLKQNPTALIVYLVLASLAFIFGIVELVFEPESVLVILGVTVFVPLNAYSLLWVFHFYKELKSGVINNAQNA